MAGFSDASRWVRTSFFLNLLGLVLETYMCISLTRVGGTHGQGANVHQAFLIVSTFFCFLTVCLNFSWAFVHEAAETAAVHFSTVVFNFIAAIFCLVIAVFGGIGGASHLTIFFLAIATFFSLISAIFLCIEISGEVTITIPKIPSPRKAKKPKTEKDAEEGEGENKEEAVELEEKKEGEKETEEVKDEGTTNGHVVKEDEKKEGDDEKKDEEEQKEGEKKE